MVVQQEHLHGPPGCGLGRVHRLLLVVGVVPHRFCSSGPGHAPEGWFGWADPARPGPPRGGSRRGRAAARPATTRAPGLARAQARFRRRGASPGAGGRLAPGGVGRVALTTPEGPIVLPVNYRVLDGTLLFRTAARSVLATAPGSRAAFEVDRIDEALRTGWSVLVVGEAAAFDEPEAIEHLVRLGSPDPWAGGERDVWVRI
ncbi:pyridoxamine 5'-phosphate oxidase family protein [Kitasatospora sp. NPDC091207]|uniref:pyridoxamine 5'-phosphate oxidase family protein n=1 Tax=Kitasatospora sp. NPDC091207 TaxID=3364083 RepID=UPI003806340D